MFWECLLCFCSQSFISNSGLWSLHPCPVEVDGVVVVFSAALTRFLSSAAVVVFVVAELFSVSCSAHQQSLSFGTFPIVVLSNVCATALIDFPSFLSFRMAYFPPMDDSLLFMWVHAFWEQTVTGETKDSNQDTQLLYDLTVSLKNNTQLRHIFCTLEGLQIKRRCIPQALTHTVYI